MSKNTFLEFRNAWMQISVIVFEDSDKLHKCYLPLSRTNWSKVNKYHSTNVTLCQDVFWQIKKIIIYSFSHFEQKRKSFQFPNYVKAKIIYLINLIANKNFEKNILLTGKQSRYKKITNLVKVWNFCQKLTKMLINFVIWAEWFPKERYLI